MRYLVLKIGYLGIVIQKPVEKENTSYFVLFLHQKTCKICSINIVYKILQFCGKLSFFIVFFGETDLSLKVSYLEL